MIGPVVVVGAGQAGSDTAAALRAHGFSGHITLVGAESEVPYQRPPLSKAYLAGKVTTNDIELRPESFYGAKDITLIRDDRVMRINRDSRRVTLASGRWLRYRRLVLAVGARPRHIPVPGADLDGVLTVRTVADADRLRQRSRRGDHLVVIGGGFLGLELAATCRALGLTVTVVEALPRVMARAVSPHLSHYLTEAHRDWGTRVLLSRQVVALHGDTGGRVRTVELDSGERIRADVVVVGVGVRPNVELAADAGLAVDNGILVDEHLRSSDPSIYAVGDCANFPSRYTGRRLRLESVQNASDQAGRAAAAICGEPKPETAVPWFWTEQNAVRVQIAGISDGHDQTAISGDQVGGRFSVFCFRAGRLTGVESVNRPADHGISRRLLAGGTGLTPTDILAPGFDLRQHAAQAA
jgi:3-phenylpropionate/trans-cinnamate dioxygenase ferredoxin reductase component